MERLNQWLTLVANFGVVIGIAFLAFEMRLNTDAIEAGTASQVVQTYTNTTTELAVSPDLAVAIDEVNANGFQSDRAALRRVVYLAATMHKSTEFAYTQWIKGNLDGGTWRSIDINHRVYAANNPFLILQWRAHRQAAPEAYRIYMDAMYRDICSKQPCPEGGRTEDWTELSA